MSATIDGSDNGEYGFPYWADKTKQTDKGYKIKSKLYAMLVHNIGVYTYVFNAHLPGGTNVTINVLHHTLTKMKEEEVQFAPILHLQLDNTVKDNKSKFVMAYLQALVDCGVFEEITVHFFQVGHTHCDIDQLFLRIAIYLKVSTHYFFAILLFIFLACHVRNVLIMNHSGEDKKVMTFEDLCNAVRQALGGMRDRDGHSFVKFVGKLSHFANFRDMVKDYLAPKSQFQGITDFQLFRLRKVVIDGVTSTEFMVKRSMHEKGEYYNFMCRQNTHQPITKNSQSLGPQFFLNRAL